MNKLEVRGVSKRFADKQVLEDISITLKEGELVCLLGVSGAGKSTLFNIISGLSLPDSGSVLLEGEDITGQTGRISYMLQKDLLLPYRTIADNVALPLLLRGMNKREARQQAAAHFAQFGLEGTEKKWPHQLSGGMRQRAALLRTYLFTALAVQAGDGALLLGNGHQRHRRDEGHAAVLHSQQVLVVQRD